MRKLMILLILLITSLVSLNSFEKIVLTDKPNATWVKQTPEQSWNEYKKIVDEYNKVVEYYSQISQTYNDLSSDYNTVSTQYKTLSFNFDAQNKKFEEYRLLTKPKKWGVGIYGFAGVDMKLAVFAGIGNDYYLYFWNERIELVLGYYVKLYDNVGGGLKLGFVVNF
jgi:hypothetical protein